MKKICIMARRLTAGGAERVASNVSVNLPDIYHQYVIVVNDDNITYPYKGEITEFKIRPSQGRFRKIKNLINKLHIIRKIYVFKANNKIDFTISFWHYGNIYNILTRKAGRSIITIHTLLSKHIQYKGFFSKMFVKLFYKKAYKIIAVSKYMKYDLVENYKISPEKIRVIYNPFDIDSIRNLSTEDIESKYIELFQNDVIISLGRISIEKGQIYLIKAFNRLYSKNSNLRLVFLGTIEDKEYKNELDKLIIEYDLSQQIYFIPFHNNPYKFLKHSKILVLSSLTEALPCVIIEALACELPIVSVDCKSGPREILSPSSDIFSTSEFLEKAEFGILTPPLQEYGANNNEIEILTDGMRLLLNNETIYNQYVTSSYKRAMDFDKSKIIQQYVEITQIK